MTKQFKYPYIPKEYYPAVMYACKKIKETHWFNKSIDWAYDEYSDRGLDYEQLKKYVSERAGAGHKKKNNEPLKYFIVRRNDYPAEYWAKNYSYFVKGARKIENLENRLSEDELKLNRKHDYGGAWAHHVDFDVFDIEISSKKLAEKIAKELNTDKRATTDTTIDISQDEEYIYQFIKSKVSISCF